LAEIDLVATSGPLEGTRFRLKRDEPLLLGRSSRGVHLADPKVSVQHAQIEYVSGRFVLTDLGSATGTSVNGVTVDAGRAMPIEPGTVLRIGDSEFKAANVGTGRWVKVVGIGLLSTFVLVVLAALLWLAFAAREGGTRLEWPQGIHVRPGEASKQVPIPPEFLRRHGLGRTTLAVDRVGDDDGNGIDEVWLSTAAAEFVVTFDEDGAWIQLGELPLGCERMRTKYDEAQSLAPSLPVVRCGGETWDISGGHYSLIGHDAPAVWFDARTAGRAPSDPAKAKAKSKAKALPPAPGAKAPPAPPPEKEPPPPPAGLSVARVRLVHPERISAFLASRGITEPVHYLICEGALDGIAAQARTASGGLVRLTPGCLDEVLFDGQKLGQVRMVAFSAVGRRALLDDLASTWGGSPEGLWMKPEDAEKLAGLSVEPGVPRGASLLTTFQVDGMVPWVQPPEVPLDERVRLLASGKDPPPPEPPAIVRTVTEAGDQVIDPPGCAKYLLTVAPFTCRLTAGCLPSRTFLRLIEVGCGEPTTVMEVPYAAGMHDIDAPTRIRARLEVRSLPDGLEITRADIGWIPAK
jgi:hypothetical protein